MEHRLAARPKTTETALPDHRIEPGSTSWPTRHPLLRLQQSLGNQTLQRLIQSERRTRRPGKVDEEGENLALQRAVAPGSTPTGQKRCACGGIIGPDGECSECRQKRLALQRSPQTGAGQAQKERAPVPTVVQEVVRQPGQPLDAETRSYFEPRFGKDFSQVRMHTGAKAAESAAAVQARAYTVGRNVVFGAGQYAPETAAGKQLLAHELTHVLQQHGQAELPTGLALGDPADSYEHEADQTAHKVLNANWRVVSEPAGRHTPQRGDFLQRTCAANPHELFYQSASNYCKDTPGTSQLHPGQTCYREVPVRSGYFDCPPGDQVCFDQDGNCHDSWDLASPVEDKNPDGTCNLQFWCSLEHADKDKVVGTWWDQNFGGSSGDSSSGGPSTGGPMDCVKQCEDLPWYLQGFCMLGCGGGPFPM